MRQLDYNKSNLMKSTLLLTSVFLAILITIPLSVAEPIETTTNILSHTGVVRNGETIQFTVWTYAGYDPVPTGSVKITNINTSEYIIGSLITGVAVINWTVSDPFISGNHIFEATYQGFQDYSSSKGKCIVLYDDFESGSSRSTSISLFSNSTLVYKNQSIRFTLELVIHSKWYFLGGYISIRNTNLNGSPVIHTYGPLSNYYPGTDPAVMTYSFDYQIPIFSPIGINSFVAEYTGSSESQTLPCSSNSHEIKVLSAGFSLIQNTDKNELQRCEDALEINTTVLGDSPIGLELRSYYYNGSNFIYLDNQTLISRTATSYFFPDNTIAIGVLSIITELVDISSEIQYVNSTLDVIIMDKVRIDHTENASEFRQEDVIHFELYVTEEDVWTNPVSCKVELIDITEGNQSIENKTTNQNGYVTFDYQIPSNITVGDHEFCFKTYNTTPYLTDIEELLSVIIKGSTKISIIYDISGVIRNHNTTIIVTVYSGEDDINEGFLSLEFADNQTVIETRSCRAGQSIDYYIIKTHPLGPFRYQIHFYGSETYDENIEQFIITVFSQPSFTDLGQNASGVIIGQTIRISGNLKDENGFPLDYEKISLFDITRGEFLGNVTTNDKGFFYFDYVIHQQIELGLHIVEMRYDGNFNHYFLATINSPICNFYVYPPLKILFESEIYAESSTIITFDGGSYDKVDIYWKRDSDLEYLYLEELTLDFNGKADYKWLTPYYGGNFSFKAVGFNSTVITPLEMLLMPRINVTGLLIWNVNNTYSFFVNSSEIYEIWIGSYLLGKCEDFVERNEANYLIAPRNREDEWSYSFQSRGNKTIRIISKGEYIHFSEYLFNITIYEDVFISLSTPLEAERGVNVIIDGAVTGDVSGPIQGIDVYLLIDGEKYSVDSTNIAGVFYFSYTFNQIGYYNVSIRTLLDKNNFYNSSQSENKLIFIKRSSTDNPPNYINFTIKLQEYESSRVKCLIEIIVHDDFGIDNVLTYIDGNPVSLYNYYNNLFIFGEIWLEIGTHSILIEAFDDTGQKYSLSDTFEVNNGLDTEFNKDIVGTLLKNDLFQLILAGGVFGVLVTMGNLIKKIRRI